MLAAAKLSRETRQHTVAKQSHQESLNSRLIAAAGLTQSGQLIQAELTYLDALRTAVKHFGSESDQVMLVSSILSSFYRSTNRTADAMSFEARLASWKMHEAVSTHAVEEPKSLSAVMSRQSGVRHIQEAPGTRPPASLRRSCQILGISMDESLTMASINRAWKKQMLSKGAHPDLGGNAEEAVLLNQAKEELVSYLEERAPKLGVKFKRTGA